MSIAANIEKKPYYVIDGVGYPSADKVAVVLLAKMLGSNGANGEAERIASLILANRNDIAEVILWLAQEEGARA